MPGGEAIAEENLSTRILKVAEQTLFRALSKIQRPATMLSFGLSQPPINCPDTNIPPPDKNKRPPSSPQTGLAQSDHTEQRNSEGIKKVQNPGLNAPQLDLGKSVKSGKRNAVEDNSRRPDDLGHLKGNRSTAKALLISLRKITKQVIIGHDDNKNGPN